MEYLDPSVIKGEISGEMNLIEIIEKIREFGDIQESRKLYQKYLIILMSI